MLTHSKYMSRLLCLLLCLALAFSLLTACNMGKDSNESGNSSTASDTIDDNPSDVVEDPASSETDTAGDETWGTDIGTDTGNNGGGTTVPEEEPEEITSLKVYNGSAPLSTQYRGVSGSVYHAYGFMKDDATGRVYTDEIMNLELSRLQEAGVRYCRTRYSSSWMWDSTLGWNFESKRMNYFYDYANALQDRGLNIVLTLGWHLNYIVPIPGKGASIGEVPYLYGEGEDRYGESAGYDFSNLNADYTRYAKAAMRYGYWYAETLKACRARGINNITHLLYFTEPSYETTTTPEGLYAAEYLFISKAIKSKLVAEGVADTVKHVGPNQGSIKHGNGLLRYVLERQPDLFDVYTAHVYPDSNDITSNVYYDVILPVFQSYTQPLKDVGVWQKKEFWVDEFYCRSEQMKLGADSPWAGLQTVIGAILAQQEGINNISLWQIFDQLWTDQTNTGGEFVNGIHVCGSAPSLFVSSIPRGQYYSTSLFARYNGFQNGKSYRTNEHENQADYEKGNLGLHIGAAQLEDGNWTITVVNTDLEDATFSVTFDKAINKTLYRHVENVTTLVSTTAAHLADADKTYVNVGDKFIDTIPGGSVVIYTSIKG